MFLAQRMSLAFNDTPTKRIMSTKSFIFMLYFKNHQLTELYPVSEKAVRNWIASARDGKLDLVLQEEGGKYYVANTAKNQRVIKELVEKRKKFTNTRGHKRVTPSEELYKLYTKEQLLDIISNIEAHREIPFQYCYFNGGARYWDQYAKRLESEETPNTLNQTIELLKTNFDNIDRLVGNHKRVNVIDLGIGNAAPTKGLVEHLLKRGVLNKYVGVDLSKAMLDIAEDNVKEWFGDKVTFEKHARDISAERFRDIITDNYLNFDSDRSLNLVLLLGGTFANLRDPNDALRTLNNSLAPGDRLIFSLKLDTPNSRRYFDFNGDPKAQVLDPKLELLLKALNFDKSYYDIESAFDKEQNMRFIRIRFKVAVSIDFKFGEASYAVNLNKDETILLWRARHITASGLINQFEENGFNTLESSQSNDHEYIVTISEIKTSNR